MSANEVSTKQKLLNVSRQLMITKGYNATTVDDVCKAAEVTKGAFFHYFKSKEVLGVSVLEQYWQQRQHQFAEADWMAHATPRQQIEGFLATVADIFVNDPDGCSCLAGSFTQEMATTSSLFRAQVAQLFDAWTEHLKPILSAAQAQSPSADAVNIDDLADHIVAVVEGALILALARGDRSVITTQLKLLNSMVQTLFAS